MDVLHVSCLNISILIKKCVYIVQKIIYMILHYKDVKNVQVTNLYSMELHVQLVLIIPILIVQSMDVKIVQEEDITIIPKNYVNALKAVLTGTIPIA